MRDGHASEVFGEQRLRELYGREVADRVLVQGQNSLFRVLNITGWTSLFWIALGLTGQIVFAGRTFVQWFVSERARKSVVPDLYWYMALVGATLLFAYFVWRRDVIGVLGQSTGVVIYARNLRLIRKQQRRDRAAAG
ncbi:MAG: lipid-A-disaccharide synthase N-terminal domain-containing protein [Phycisphaeraceae bacterium]|nr:lipid-A-disaccharide synthase N-terminal domain-containing protein [Phycisphaeraceae bacterium]